MLRLIACAALATTASISAAAAADLYIPSEPMPITSSVGFDWEGLYAGVSLGGYFEEDDDVQGLIAGTIGYNFLVADPVLVGVELQGAYYFENDDLLSASEVMLYGRVGVLASESILLYGIGGVGLLSVDGDEADGQYALGVGIEAAVTESISLRGEVKAFGLFDDDEAFFGTTATAGVFFHF